MDKEQVTCRSSDRSTVGDCRVNSPQDIRVISAITSTMILNLQNRKKKLLSVESHTAVITTAYVISTDLKYTTVRIKLHS